MDKKHCKFFIKKNIKIVDLLENPIEGNIFQNGEMFNLEVPPYKILTLHIT